MSHLKRTQLYDVHTAARAAMVDFGGWEMPMEYPAKIVAEHLYTRSHCSLFDVSHMGRILVDGTDAVPFLQHVLSSNVMALDLHRRVRCSGESGPVRYYPQRTGRRGGRRISLPL